MGAVVVQSLPDQCAARLRAQIVGGQRAAGSRLPPEKQLAEELGVTRPTLRSALHQLLALGLLSVKQGSGYTVRDLTEEGGPRLLGDVASLAATQGHLPEVAAELLRVRRHLAAALLERLAATRPDLAPVRRAVGAFEVKVAVGAVPEALAAADAEVVGALLRASGSLVLQLCFNPVRQVLRSSPALAAALYAEPQANVAGWKALLA
jgi:GntR family transcriptional repressor for pyruvate dehydrogenase complex